MGYYGYPSYVTVAERQVKAERKLKQLRKKNPNIQPVRVQGRSLSTTWWGKSWNKNLESYADFHNRIGRGRSYLRHGAVLDLKITPGVVTGLVAGSGRYHYEVKIQIGALEKPVWKKIQQSCQGRLESMGDLLAGKFPKALQDIFMTKGSGLFPSPQEISFDCSCPDWASMCKHVAAVLYGIGTRLDEEPALFFSLRKVSVEALIAETVQDNVNDLLKKGEASSKRILAADDLGDLFGIELESELEAVETPKTKTTAKSKTSQSARLPKSRATQSTSKPVPSKRKPGPPRKEAVLVHPNDQVLDCLNSSSQALTVSEIAAQTGLLLKPLYGILYRLKTKGLINSPALGVYKRKTKRQR